MFAASSISRSSTPPAPPPPADPPAPVAGATSPTLPASSSAAHNINISDDVTEFAYLRCNSCFAVEFPGCEDHGLLSWPTTTPSDNSSYEAPSLAPLRAKLAEPTPPKEAGGAVAPAAAPEAWAQLGVTAKVQCAAKCAWCRACVYTAFPWSYHCRFCKGPPCAVRFGRFRLGATTALLAVANGGLDEDDEEDGGNAKDDDDDDDDKNSGSDSEDDSGPDESESGPYGFVPSEVVKLGGPHKLNHSEYEFIKGYIAQCALCNSTSPVLRSTNTAHYPRHYSDSIKSGRGAADNTRTTESDRTNASDSVSVCARAKDSVCEYRLGSQTKPADVRVYRTDAKRQAKGRTSKGPESKGPESSKQSSLDDTQTETCDTATDTDTATKAEAEAEAAVCAALAQIWQRKLEHFGPQCALLAGGSGCVAVSRVATATSEVGYVFENLMTSDLLCSRSEVLEDGDVLPVTLGIKMTQEEPHRMFCATQDTAQSDCGVSRGSASGLKIGRAHV